MARAATPPRDHAGVLQFRDLVSGPVIPGKPFGRLMCAICTTFYFSPDDLAFGRQLYRLAERSRRLVSFLLYAEQSRAARQT